MKTRIIVGMLLVLLLIAVLFLWRIYAAERARVVFACGDLRNGADVPKKEL